MCMSTILHLRIEGTSLRDGLSNGGAADGPRWRATLGTALVCLSRCRLRRVASHFDSDVHYGKLRVRRVVGGALSPLKAKSHQLANLRWRVHGPGEHEKGGLYGSTERVSQLAKPPGL